MNTEQVAIVGAGPAGIAAAIQLKRWGITPLLLEKDQIGRLLLNANLVENYPGFPQGIPGPELVALFKAQMERIGVDVAFEEVLDLNYEDRFIIQTSKRRFASRFVIIASGTSPNTLTDLQIPAALSDRVLTEVYPLLNYSGKKMAIIGAGDAAFDYALNLASKNNEITILNRSSTRKCLPLLWERCRQSSYIGYFENTTISKIEESEGNMLLHCKNDQGDWELTVDYVILAIGRVPQRGFLSTQMEGVSPELESKGLLYFAGDVRNGVFRQTSIAVGDGVRAAMSICQLSGESR